MSNVWKIVLMVAGVALVIALFFAGWIVPLVALVLLLLVLGGGALLYRSSGPPQQ
jgi:hypothetical protein